MDDLQPEDGKHIWDASNAELALPGSEFDAVYDDIFTPHQDVLTACYEDDSSFLSDSYIYTPSTANTEISENRFTSDGDRKFNSHKSDSDRFSNDDVSCAFDSSFDFDIGISSHGNSDQREIFSFTNNMKSPYKFKQVDPCEEILEMRKFKSSRKELPMKCVTPLQVTNGPTTTISGSLLELSTASAIEEQMDKEMSLTEDSSPPKRTLSEQRKSSQGKKDKPSRYPTPLTSDEDSFSPSLPKSRRNGHVAGFNRKTGELTLVGTYPPDFRDNIYHCPDPICREVNGKDVKWTTKNGYKYHLEHNCLRNPKSRTSLRLKSGNVEMKPTKPGFSKECQCGATFKSETGFRMHQTQNESTRDGRCLLKAKRRCHTRVVPPEDDQYEQGQIFDIHLVNPEYLTLNDFAKQGGEIEGHGSYF